MPPHPFTSVEIQKHYQNEPKLEDVSWKINLPWLKGEAYVIDLEEWNSIGTHWIALCVNGVILIL